MLRIIIVVVISASIISSCDGGSTILRTTAANSNVPILSRSIVIGDDNDGSNKEEIDPSYSIKNTPSTATTSTVGILQTPPSTDGVTEDHQHHNHHQQQQQNDIDIMTTITNQKGSNNPFFTCIQNQSHRIRQQVGRHLQQQQQQQQSPNPNRFLSQPSLFIQKSIIPNIYKCNIMNQYQNQNCKSSTTKIRKQKKTNVYEFLIPFLGNNRGGGARSGGVGVSGLSKATIAATPLSSPTSSDCSTSSGSINDNIDEKKHLYDTTNVSTSTKSKPSSSSSSSSSNKDNNKNKKRRKNNTGFYYGIQDDVFFKDKTTSTTEDETTTKNNDNDQRKGSNDDSFQMKSRKSYMDQSESNYKSSSPPTFSSNEALGDIMGETLLELREMREDIMALREEMHYMKEEMRRNNQMRSSSPYYNDDNGLEGDELNDDDSGMRSSSSGIAQTIQRKKEFDFISKDVEKWAHKLLFEENGEVNGWKEVNCNKMVRNKFNRNGLTKCYLKWMKDSRKSISNHDYTNDDETEYPCIKCYSTLNAPIEQVCDFLAKESNMPEYNDLVISYKDLEDIGPQSKICWSQCPQILFIKPRDFVTFCHFRWRKDGTQIVVNQACDHVSAPGNEDEGDGKICRAYALRGANFISRDPDDPTKTRMAILAHANPGGGIPQWAMKTAANAIAPIEPFKLFHKIDTCVCAHQANIKNKADMVSSLPGRIKRSAGLSQLGYACFWPHGGNTPEGNNELNSMEREKEYITSDYF